MISRWIAFMAAVAGGVAGQMALAFFKRARTAGPHPLVYTGAGPAPQRQHSDDAGFDLYYHGQHPILIEPGDSADVPAGVSVEAPRGCWCLLVGRSSTLRSKGLLVNVAVIDPGYRGELFAVTRNVGLREQVVNPGERIAQLVPLPAFAPYLEPHWVQQLAPSARGSNGLGSTGA